MKKNIFTENADRVKNIENSRPQYSGWIAAKNAQFKVCKA